MIRNWNEFDNKLREVALIDIAVKEAARLRDLTLIEAETEYKAATATKLAARKAVEGELEKFYRANRKEAEKGGKRSIELMFGRAGIRARAARLRTLKGVKWEQVVGRIKECLIDWKPFIRVKESVNKDEVKRRFTPEMLEQVGLSMKGSEEFFIETFPEKVGTAERVA